MSIMKKSIHKKSKITKPRGVVKSPKKSIQKKSNMNTNKSTAPGPIGKDITTLDQILDNKYGGRGTAPREKWEQNFETFRLGVILEEARKKLNMTQEELAAKCGTNKAYISRIENDGSDIRLSTLMKIIYTGLGGKLTLTLDK
jgi:HTH-type transcriptional regulator / antitoxin HipB